MAHDLVAVHATDPASVYLALAARVPGLKPDDVAAALYERRSLLRMLGMRRTMFVVPVGTAPIVQHSSTGAIAARLRRQLVQHLEPVVPEAGPWLDAIGDSVLTYLREHGDAPAVDIAAAEPRLRTTLSYAEGKAYGGQVAITTRVLTLLAAEGRIVRGRPSGGWTSSRYVWSPVERWLPDGLPRIPAATARAALLRAWLFRFGPATVDDAVWWTGWSRGDVRRALAEIDIVDVDLDGRPGLLLADDIDVVPAPPEWIALLPALDATPMGWFGRGWYLDERGPRTALRLLRQHRPVDLVRRPGGRWMGAAAWRRGGVAAPARHRRARDRGGGRRGRPAHGVARGSACCATLSHPAGARTRRIVRTRRPSEARAVTA